MVSFRSLLLVLVVAGCSATGVNPTPPVAAVVDPAGPPAPGMAQTAFEGCTPGMPPAGTEAVPSSDVEVVAWPWGVEVIHVFYRQCCEDQVDVEAEIQGQDVVVREIWTHEECDCVCEGPFRVVTQVGLETGDYLFELDVLNGKDLENVLFTSVEIAPQEDGSL
jgi:hypothetical protein